MARSARSLTGAAQLLALLYAVTLLVLVTLLAVLVVSSPVVVSSLTRMTQPSYILPEEGSMLERSIEVAALTADFVRLGNQEAEMIELYRQDEAAGLESIGHLLDVRDVFITVWYVAGLSAVLVVIGAASAHFLRAEEWMRLALRVAAVLCRSVPVVLGLIVALAFGPLFTFFHRVFFPQGNWQFPSDSYLIQTFPEPFWISATALILVLVALGGVSLYGVSRLASPLASRRLPAPSDAC